MLIILQIVNLESESTKLVLIISSGNGGLSQQLYCLSGQFKSL